MLVIEPCNRAVSNLCRGMSGYTLFCIIQTLDAICNKKLNSFIGNNDSLQISMTCAPEEKSLVVSIVALITATHMNRCWEPNPYLNPSGITFHAFSWIVYSSRHVSKRQYNSSHLQWSSNQDFRSVMSLYQQRLHEMDPGPLFIKR